MKKIISIVMLMICIINMILPVSVVNAEENTEYECIQLPIISDKSKEAVTNITLYKDNDTLYAPLHTVCPLINAEWYMKDGGFYISRDNCMYFRFYHDGNMKLIIDLDIGDDKWNKSDNVLLEGNIFSCKKIGVEWCVDFIKFCDMFGVTFRQVSPSTIQSAKDNIKKNIEDSAFEKLNSIDIENDLDFNNNPYYIYLYTGTPLISLYAQVMRDKNLYIWDYSCYENLNLSEEDNAWIEEILKSIQYSDITQYLTIQSQNCLSYVVNDNWGITKLITAPPYDSSEHYKKALVNISSINYGENLKLEDIESINQNNKAQELERLLNSNTILSSSDSTITILTKYLNDKIKIPELKAFTKVSDVINWIGTPFQTYFEVENFYNKLNSINEDKVQLLTKSIIENDSINNVAEKQKIGNDILSYLNKTASTNIFLNSIDNYAGLMDSSKEICSLYKNSDKQFKEKLSQSIESELYALGDSAISKMLEKSGNPYLVLTGAVIGVYDGFTAWIKENFGEQLQNSEILVQAYFIERIMKESLDIKNTENLYNRLTLMLQSSLCCFEYDENYFQTNRNKISKMLYMLDNDKSININYYHDPKNDNVDENVINAIKKYSDNKIESNDNYTWHLAPTIEAEDIIISDVEKINYYGFNANPFDEYSIVNENGKYRFIKYDGTYISDNQYDQWYFSKPDTITLSSENGEISILGYDDNKIIYQSDAAGWGRQGFYIDNKTKEVYATEYDSVSKYNESDNIVVQSADVTITSNGQNSSTLELNNVGKYGIANSNGLVVDCIYDDACMNIGSNIIALEKNGKWGYFNKDGTQIINFVCEPFESKILDVMWLHTYDNENIQYPYLNSCGYIPVKINGQCGYYDTQGNEVIPFGTFEEVRPVHNCLAWVKKDGKWGVIKLVEITEPATTPTESNITAVDLIDKTLPEIISFMNGEYQIIKTENDGYIYIQNQSVLSGMEFYVQVSGDDIISANNGEEIHSDTLKAKLESGELTLDGIQVNKSGKVNDSIQADMDYQSCSKVLGNFNCIGGTGGYLCGDIGSISYNYNDNNAKVILNFEIPEEIYRDLSLGKISSVSAEKMKSYNPKLKNVVIRNVETNTNVQTEQKSNTNNFNINDYNGMFYPNDSNTNAYIIINSQSEKNVNIEVNISNPKATYVSQVIFSGNVDNSVLIFEEYDDFGRNSYTLEFLNQKVYLTAKCIESYGIWGIPELNKLELTKQSEIIETQIKDIPISDIEILWAVNKYLEENKGHLGTYLTVSDAPYCPTEHMYSNDKKWSCPINLSWESYSANDIAGAYPHFAYVDKSTLKCTLTANYETVVEFDLKEYIK